LRAKVLRERDRWNVDRRRSFAGVFGQLMIALLSLCPQRRQAGARLCQLGATAAVRGSASQQPAAGRDRGGLLHAVAGSDPLHHSSDFGVERPPNVC
jgi:hypothetical protein